MGAGVMLGVHKPCPKAPSFGGGWALEQPFPPLLVPAPPHLPLSCPMFPGHQQ